MIELLIMIGGFLVVRAVTIWLTGNRPTSRRTVQWLRDYEKVRQPVKPDQERAGP